MSLPASLSALTHLICPQCNSHYDADILQTYCLNCNSPLLASYDLDSVRKRINPADIKIRPRGLWRWVELLPIRNPANLLTLGEGDTPLLSAPGLGAIYGLPNLYIKDESGNPGGTFKARGLAVAVSRGNELGVDTYVIPSAGNAGGALALYAARAGYEAHVFMPTDAPKTNQDEVRISGATLHLVDGLIDMAAKSAASYRTEHTQNGKIWFDVSTFKEPYRLEGKKTMGFEIAESFDWQLPDVIIYPTGGGTGLVGIWKAFEELKTLGWIGDHRPRLVSVQAEGCSPIVRAFQKHADRVEPWKNAHTLAAGLRVPILFADRLILRALYDSQGLALDVSDQEILDAQQQMAQVEGIFPAPEGAATLAALRKLVETNWIEAEESVVLLNTGGGLKYVLGA